MKYIVNELLDVGLLLLSLAHTSLSLFIHKSTTNQARATKLGTFWSQCDSYVLGLKGQRSGQGQNCQNQFCHTVTVGRARVPSLTVE